MVTLPRSLGNTQGYAMKDSNFTLQDESDTTKQAQFQLSGLTTATTRTYTLPDASTTLVGTGTTQTLTGKTLTSPEINTPTIDTPTITTPTLNGTPTIGSPASWRTALAVQPLDDELTAIAGLTSAPDKGIYFTGSGSAGIFTLTSTGRTFLGAANVAAQQVALDLEPGVDVMGYDAGLAAYAALSTSANKGREQTAWRDRARGIGAGQGFGAGREFDQPRNRGGRREDLQIRLRVGSV